MKGENHMTQKRIDTNIRANRQMAISSQFWRKEYSKRDVKSLTNFERRSLAECERKVLNISDYGRGIKRIKKGIYVLDTSVAGIDEYEKVLFRLIETESVTIVTSIVNDELEQLKNREYEPNHHAANNILWWVATNPKYFKMADIPKYGNYDDRIIDYCIAKGDVILLTADKHMANDARGKGVRTIFLTDRDVGFENTWLKAKYVDGENITLPIANYREDDGWFIGASQFEKQDQSVLVVNETGTRKIRVRLRLFVGMQVIWLKRMQNATYVLHSRIDSVSPNLCVTKVFEATVPDGKEVGDIFYQATIELFNEERLDSCLN